MNTVLSTHVDEQQHRHPRHQTQIAHRATRVGVVDRVALHLGIALITWSRRPATAPRPEREYNPSAYRERAAARADREARWQHAMYTTLPWH